MQERCRLGVAATWLARAPSQPDSEKGTMPAADNRSQSRRERRGKEVSRSMRTVLSVETCAIPAPPQAHPLQRVGLHRGFAGGSMVEDEFRAVEERPEDVAQ